MLRSTRSSAIRPLTLAVFAVVSALSAGQAFAGKAMLSGLQSDRSFDQFIVKYRDGSLERKDAAIINRGLSRAAQAVVGTSRKAGGLGVKHFRRMSLGADVIRSDRKLDRVDAETLMRQIAADPSVEYVEVDIRMYPVLTPNDTRYADQWHYFGATAGANLPAAWDKSTGSGMVIAIIDTGSTPHSDLVGNTVAGYDFITSTTASQDGNGRDSNPNDQGDWYTNSACGSAPTPSSKNSSWHGTHVAGTVAALTNNGKGVAGVAYGAKVQHARVLGRCGGSTSDIADAIIWASGGTVSGVPANATPAKILNLSLGGSSSSCPSTYQDAINSAVGRGATVVVSAGNSNNNASGNTPANCANVITVGAIDSAGKRSVWSTQYNQLSSYGSVVDLAAPGSTIWSTLNAGTQGQGAESYAAYGGTSMAAPHVTGVAALVQSRRQALGLALYTPAQLETLLKNTVRAFPQTPDQLLGAGMLNADAAVTAAGGGGGTSQTYTNSADYTINDNATISSPITVSGRTGNGSGTTPVAVNIVHTYKGDLKVDLVAPDGSVYTLHNYADGSIDNIVQTFPVNLSSEALNGTWNLRVNDNAANDVGYINSWSVTF